MAIQSSNEDLCLARAGLCAADSFMFFCHIQAVNLGDNQLMKMLNDLGGVLKKIVESNRKEKIQRTILIVFKYL